MRSNRLFLIVGVSVLALAGCTSTKKKGGGGGGGGGGDSSSVPVSKDDPDGYAGYSARYKNKKDCFGEDVADYHLYDSYGMDLVENVHNYCIDQHKTWLGYVHSPSNYGQYFAETDKDPSTGKVLQFYTAYQGSSGTSREHVWCCANSADLWYRQSQSYEHKIDQNYTYWGGGSDIYNLHACTSSVNSARSNAKYIVFPESERAELTSYGDNGPYKLLVNPAGNKCEPAKEYRGNIARIVMYMWCHYREIGGARNAYYPSNYSSRKPVYTLSEAVKGSGHSPYICGVSLSLSNIIGYSTDAEIYAALKQWNAEDPVDANEQYANNYIESKLQGNRNPFVDYPQLVDNVLDWLE